MTGRLHLGREAVEKLVRLKLGSGEYGRQMEMTRKTMMDQDRDHHDHNHNQDHHVSQDHLVSHPKDHLFSKDRQDHHHHHHDGQSLTVSKISTLKSKDNRKYIAYSYHLQSVYVSIWHLMVSSNFLLTLVPEVVGQKF